MSLTTYTNDFLFKLDLLINIIIYYRPVKTYNTACTFYHRFRFEHPTPDYNYTDAALASLFVACKVEDTLKKSREIICAHHNLKNPDHQTTQDDKVGYFLIHAQYPTS